MKTTTTTTITLYYTAENPIPILHRYVSQANALQGTFDVTVSGEKG
jgi:hypothetical protein